MSQFDHISIQTTQNVNLQYEVSSVGDRLLAFIIDSIIIYGLAFLIAFTFDLSVGFDSDSSTIIGILLSVIPLCFYHVVFEIFNNGQSIGKKIMKIRVIRMDGTEPTLGNYMIRWISRALEMYGLGVFGLSLVAILINGKGQRLGDMAGGTTVAKVKKRVGLEDTILAFSNENYKPRYPLSKTLSARDIEVIKESMHFYIQYQNHSVVNACGMKVKSLLGIDPYQDFTPNDQFLEDVVNDYTYFKSLDESTPTLQ